MMGSVARHVSGFFRRPIHTIDSMSCGSYHHYQQQQLRGIRVKVLDGNLERALTWMQRKMQSSGIERLIKREQTHHIKNSERRVLARKNLERKIRSQDLARKLKAILIKKVRADAHPITIIVAFLFCFGNLEIVPLQLRLLLLVVVAGS